MEVSGSVSSIKSKGRKSGRKLEKKTVIECERVRRSTVASNKQQEGKYEREGMCLIRKGG